MAPESTGSSNGFEAACCLNPERAGREGYLGLHFKRRGPDTVLSRCRFALPLQALTPLSMADGTAYLMMLNPTGGVLGGDRLIAEIVQDEGTHVCLSTPSATRIYRTVQEKAHQETSIRLGAGAILEYFPDHIIPHTGSALSQSLRVQMGDGSKAILFEAAACGRLAHGERWQFRELESATEVSLGQRPLYVSRSRIVPSLIDPRRLGAMEDFNYTASLGVFADGPYDWKSIEKNLAAQIAAVDGIFGGTSLLPRNGCLVRFLTKTAVQLSAATLALWASARESLLQLPPFELRKY